jgi:hypothetical protein
MGQTIRQRQLKVLAKIDEVKFQQVHNIRNASSLNSLADKLNPHKYNFSPKLTAIVGAILGHDYGVRDRKGGHLTSISITSDGYVIAASTASDGGGAFIGDAEEMTRNLDMLFKEVHLTQAEREEFCRLWNSRVTDYRGDRSKSPAILKLF